MVCCLTVLGCIVAAVAALKIYLKLSTGWDRSATCLVGKTTIVTGANAGIGYYTALDFAKRGARVILACRNLEKAENAKISIIDATGNPNVVVKIIDMASLKSVREFAKDINSTEERLDILVNNAGAGYLEDNVSEDGLQLLMQVNQFSAFLLTNLLIGLLKKSAPSRIVMVSSEVSRIVGSFDVNKLNSYPKDSKISEILNYGISKLVNIMFANELARKLTGTKVTVNSLCPGMVLTDFMSQQPPLRRIPYLISAAIFAKDANAGAQTSIYVAVSKDLDGVTGKYFKDCKLQTINKLAEDSGLAKKTWEMMEKLVKLKPEEIQF